MLFRLLASALLLLVAVLPAHGAIIIVRPGLFANIVHDTALTTTSIHLRLFDPTPHLESDGSLIFSVELPALAPPPSEVRVVSLNTPATGLPLAPVDDAPCGFGAVLPPGPDLDTVWYTYRAAGPAVVPESPLDLIAVLPATDPPLAFTRLLVGPPSTRRSRIAGAFDSTVAPAGTVIRRGVDYLGTDQAHQRFRIPANSLVPFSLEFDSMVDFGKGPLLAGTNIDTVMLREVDITPGQTTPVRLIAFRNRTVRPIEIPILGGGVVRFEITATLSPNARSGGFLTILPDGNYRSTTSLWPLLSFQQVDDAGEPIGDPIVLDSALADLPGFPFYLASNGGRWTSEAPAGRYTDGNTTNFFYDNGSTNRFNHSNGGNVLTGPTLAACAKASAASLLSR